MAWPSEPKIDVVRRLNQDLIITVGLELLLEHGTDGVSMRRIAQKLETGAASLYAHVAGKEELYELMLDRLLGTVAIPEPAPERWQEQLKEVARAQLEVLTTYPGIARVAMETTVPTGPNALRHGEGILALLRAGGLPDRVAALAFDTLTLWCAAFATEVSAARSGEIDPDEIARRGEQIGAYMADRAGEFPNLVNLGPTLGATPPEERFEFALDLFLAGLTSLAKV